MVAAKDLSFRVYGWATVVIDGFIQHGSFLADAVSNSSKRVGFPRLRTFLRAKESW